MQRTISVVLDKNPAIADTISQFNECCNFFLKLGFENRTSSKRKLQMLGYFEARKRFPKLPSALVQGARDCAHDMLKREKLQRLPTKRPYSSARFDRRTAKAFLESGTLSITTVNGRLKVPLRVARYFDKYKGGKVISLRVRNDRGILRADLIVDLPDVPIKAVHNPKVIGMDRGIVNTAVLSNNVFFNSKTVRNVRARYTYLVRRLQSAGTRSAKRHLCRLRGRERRFRADVNHRIAKSVAAMEFDVLVLEDLSVKKDKKFGRRFNRKLGGWSFFQLERFLAYKLEEVGKCLVKVPPEYTSQMCSRCGNIGVRNGNNYRCGACGLRLNADLNAARNIAKLGKALLGRPIVNGPIVASDDAGHGTSDELSYKPPILMGGS